MKFNVLVATFETPAPERAKMKTEDNVSFETICVDIDSSNIDNFGNNPEYYIKGFDMENSYVLEISGA